MRTLILTKNDLFLRSRDKSIDDITNNDISLSLDKFKRAEFVIFVEDKYNFKVLKNRFGNNGLPDELPEDVLNEIRLQRLNWILFS